MVGCKHTRTSSITQDFPSNPSNLHLFIAPCTPRHRNYDDEYKGNGDDNDDDGKGKEDLRVIAFAWAEVQPPHPSPSTGVRTPDNKVDTHSSSSNLQACQRQ